MSTPQSFAQLHANATLGPYKLGVVELWEGAPTSHAVIGKDGKQICSNESYYPCAVLLADQELICRLLNFAEAGGVEILTDAMNCLELSWFSRRPPAEVVQTLGKRQRLMEILNGETAP